MADEAAGQGSGGGKWDGPTEYAPPPLAFTRRLNFRMGILVVASVVPLFVLSFLSALRSREAAVHAAGAEAGRLARISARNQEEAFAQAGRLLAAVAESPVVLGGTDAERSAFLKDLLARSPGYGDFHLVRPDGSIAAGALAPDDSKALCDEKVLDRVRRTNLAAVGDFEKGPSGRPTAYLARPLPGGGLVLGATLALAWLDKFQSALQLPPGSVLDVLDPAGLNLLRVPAAGPGDVGQIHPAPRLQAENTQDAERPLLGEDTDGVRRFFGIQPFATGGTKNYLVVVGIPEEAVVAPADRALTLGVVVSLIVLVASLVLAQFMAEQFILRRVNGLILATRRLASTDLKDLKARRRVCQDPSELGDLERAFDEMAKAMEKRAQELEARARELEGKGG